MESRPTYTTPVARASTPAHGGYGKPPYIYDTRCTGFHTREPARRLWKAAYIYDTRCTGFHTRAPARRLWKAAYIYDTRCTGFHTRAPARRLWKAALLLTSGEPARRLWKAALHIRHPLHGFPYPRACTAAMESRPTYATPVARVSIPARLHGGYGKPPYICDTRSAGFHTRAPARRLWKAALHIRHPLHGLPHPRTAAMESRPTSHERRGRARSSVSRINVTGPSLWISTSMCAWKRPSSTRTPRPRSA